MYMVPELIAAREIFCGQQALYPNDMGQNMIPQRLPKPLVIFGYLWYLGLSIFDIDHMICQYIYIQLYTHSYHRWLFYISPIFIISRPCIILYLHVPFLDPFVAKIAACGVTFGRKLEELEAVDPVRTALVKGEIRENTHG